MRGCQMSRLDRTRMRSPQAIVGQSVLNRVGRWIDQGYAAKMSTMTY